MSNKYPLHPGQTEVSPYYVQIPQSEYEALKRENEQLHALFHGVKSQDSDAEIDTLASECRVLRAMNAKAQEEIAKLKENQRWRDLKNEKPKEGERVLISDEYNDDDSVSMAKYTENHNWELNSGAVILTDCYPFWMPKPKAPEVDNESKKIRGLYGNR